MLKRLAAILLLAALPVAALAQLRTIPQDAKRGQLRHLQEMDVSVDGVRESLAPGAQIRDASNRVVLPATVQSETPIRYRRDREGRVNQVWILSAEEAAQAQEGK
jgi:hypothetical protein